MAPQRIIVSKPLFYILGIFVVVAFLRGSPQDPCGFVGASNAKRSLDLEQRKIELEEREVYLTALQGSEMTEEKAREVSLRILQSLKDYPQGKKAKHSAEDVQMLIETLSTLQTSTTAPIR
jgi:hypothetical protein